MSGKEPNVFTNDNCESTDKKIKENDRLDGLLQILISFADKCSMSGISFIKNTENRLVRIIWSCLLLTALGLLTFHLYKLTSTYFDYKKQTEYQLSFDKLRFPAVTICNVNPLRMSQKGMASTKLTEYIDSVDPDIVLKNLEEWTPDLGDDEEIGGNQSIVAANNNVLRGKMEKRKPTAADKKNLQDKKKAKNRTYPALRRTQRGKGRANRFLDGLSMKTLAESTMIERARYKLIHERDRHSWETEAAPSGLWTLEQRFHQLFVQEPPSARSQMGHQIDDMLLQCSFAGRQCDARNFTLLLSSQYGNCYTLQYRRFLSRMSGPADGLQLKLYLEAGEYLPGITNSQGIQVVIHDQGTLPFPGEEGLAVRAGTETFIGLRRVEVSRIGYPHGKCTPADNFGKRLRFKYTKVTCQKFCQQKMIYRQCECYDRAEQEINTYLGRLRNTKPCKTWKEIQCAMRISLRFEKTNTLCGCYRPCNETTFERTVLSRNWPNPAFAKVLSSVVCKSNSSSCDSLLKKTGSDLRDEFINLVIYYEDLNYEQLTELANYKLDQFLSDVGGTIGLWIGLSLLSVFEIFHLIADIFRYICCGRRGYK